MITSVPSHLQNKIIHKINAHSIFNTNWWYKAISFAKPSIGGWFSLDRRLWKIYSQINKPSVLVTGQLLSPPRTSPLSHPLVPYKATQTSHGILWQLWPMKSLSQPWLPRTYFPAHGIDSDWFIVLSASILIGQSNCFAFSGFSTLSWKLLTYLGLYFKYKYFTTTWPNESYCYKPNKCSPGRASRRRTGD